MARFLAALSCAVVLVGCAGDSSDGTPDWSHDRDDRELGPTAWGEIDESFGECATGDEQSPVDIAATTPDDVPRLVFDYAPSPLVVENTGHVVEVPLPEDSDNTLTIGEDVYRLVQYHFHAPSEHTLAGESFDAEVHLVHESEGGELAVLGVLIDRGGPGMPLVNAVLEGAPEEAGEEVELGREANPLELLAAADTTNADISSYYTYPGSLTTPGCTEGVRWILLSGIILVASRTALDHFHEVIADFPHYDGYEKNNRPKQPLNERVVTRSAP